MSTINIACLINNVGNTLTTVEDLKCYIIAGGMNDTYYQLTSWLNSYAYYTAELDRLYMEGADWSEIEMYETYRMNIENECMTFMDSYTYPEMDKISLVGECNGCLSYMCPLYSLTGGLFANIHVKTIDLSGITDLENMCNLQGLCMSSLVEKVIFPTSEIVDANGQPFELAEWGAAFSGCEKLTTLQNFTNFKCNVMNGQNIFQGCSSLKKLDLSSIGTFKEYYTREFDSLSSLEELVLPGAVDSSLVLPKGCGLWFLTDENNNALTGLPATSVTNALINTENAAKLMLDVNGQINNLNIEDWLKKYYFTLDADNNMIWLGHYAADTTVTSINIPQTAMFNGRSYAVGISYYDTGHSRTNMSYMWPSTVTSIYFEGEIVFQGNTSNGKVFPLLTSLQTINHENLIFKGSGYELFRRWSFADDSFVAKINPKSKITSGHSMFANCKKLIAPDFSELNVSAMTSLNGIFSGCSNLQSINLSSWDISKVTTTSSMFSSCSSLQSIDLSSWNFSAVEDMSYIFQYCSKLQTVNLGQINTSSLTKPTSMFYNCPLLETITSASFNTSKVTTSATATVFYNCPLLKGAIAFDSTKKGWDMLNSKTGYFTWISNAFIIRKGTISSKIRRIINSDGDND